MKLLSEKEYVDAEGGVCPFCRGDNVESEGFDFDGGFGTCEVSCEDCGRAWTDTLALTGYVVRDEA